MTESNPPDREGQTVPAVRFRIRRDGDRATVTTAGLFGGKNFIVLTLPGAFTPTRSSTYLPK